MKEMVFGIIMMVICVILYFIADSYPSTSLQRGGGASFYPKFLVVTLFILMIIYLIQNRYKIKAAFEQKNKRIKKEQLLSYRCLVLLLAVLCLVPISLRYLGFIMTAFGLVVCSSMIIRLKESCVSWKGFLASCVLGLVVSIGIYVTFAKVFVILLPTGELF